MIEYAGSEKQKVRPTRPVGLPHCSTQRAIQEHLLRVVETKSAKDALELRLFVADRLRLPADQLQLLAAVLVVAHMEPLRPRELGSRQARKVWQPHRRWFGTRSPLFRSPSLHHLQERVLHHILYSTCRRREPASDQPAGDSMAACSSLLVAQPGAEP